MFASSTDFPLEENNAGFLYHVQENCRWIKVWNINETMNKNNENWGRDRERKKEGKKEEIEGGRQEGRGTKLIKNKLQERKRRLGGLDLIKGRHF